MADTLEVRALTKHYGAIAAVQNVSFAVPASEIFGLLGPNGAGKTTTLECIMGLRRPDRGSITIAGIDALAAPNRIRPLLGAQLQATALPEKITPRQALRLFGAFHRPRPDVAALLTEFALDEKADASFDSLSGGQQKRLALALAFAHAPQLLVLDEPTAGLDPAARRDLHDIITRRRAAGCTVLLSTHQLDEAERLCDRLAIIDDGRVVAVGRPDELIAQTGAVARVVVRAAQPLDAAPLSGLTGVQTIAPHGEGWILTTIDPNHTLVELAQFIARRDNTLLELQIQRPSLEDAFLHLTGHAWVKTSKAA